MTNPQLSTLPTGSLGFPRMGPHRELTFAVEKYWKGLLDKEGLLMVSKTIEEMSWKLQAKHGLSKIAVGDFVFYDQVLAWTEWFGFIPKRFHHLNRGIDLQFAMARGRNEAAALDMTKWFDTNYHYEVPELTKESRPEANFAELLEKVKRAVSVLGASKVSPVILGPVTFLRLSKIVDGQEATAREEILGRLLPVYKELFSQLKATGVTEIQIHEPALVMPANDGLRKLFEQAYDPAATNALLPASGNLKVNIVSYFEDVGEANYRWLCSLPVQQISLDFTRGDSLSLLLKHGFPADKTLGAGIIDGRNVWKMNPETVTRTLQQIFGVTQNVVVQPSCSLQHVPWDVTTEKEYVGPSSRSKNIRPILSFALQKLEELRTVASYQPAASALKADDVHVYSSAWKSFQKELTASNSVVPDRVNRMVQDKSSMTREMPYDKRRPLQLPDLPLLPTTTIGSFPQTASIRHLRQDFRKGLITKEEYQHGIDKQIAYAIGVQEALGLDILVHGEAERTDMVEFFGEQLEGMAFTSNGWVQSYGSRCVRPPVLCDHISRKNAMTIREFAVAQALTKKPVKGMLTGPVTILNWSFPRVDIPRREQAYQLALCIRDEIKDLEEAGCKVIQVDEPALREGMPLKPGKKQEYLDWAVNAFLLATTGASPATQIHTHMCYCEFEDCMDAIDRLDTDVNSIENARSSDATLKAFKSIGYSKGLGPGVYDIHSPVVPTVEQMKEKIAGFLKVLPAHQLVVNPDCGLKTRTWAETLPALKNMVEAAAYYRDMQKA